MSRDWLALYPRIVRLPKFRKLPESAQLTLVYVWCLATDVEPEATWPSVAALADELMLHGRPAEDVAALVESGFLDIEDDGIDVHDWDDHQLAASKAIRDAWEARRKRLWRRTRRESPPAPPLQEKREQDRTGQDIGPGRCPDTVRTPSGRDHGRRPASPL